MGLAAKGCNHQLILESFRFKKCKCHYKIYTDGSAWAQKTLGTMAKMSPTAMKVVHRQIIEGAKRNFEECFMMEIKMAKEFMGGSEFFEGVRSVLVDKDRNAKWSPSTLEEVSNEAVDKYF